MIQCTSKCNNHEAVNRFLPGPSSVTFPQTPAGYRFLGVYSSLLPSFHPSPSPLYLWDLPANIFCQKIQNT